MKNDILRTAGQNSIRTIVNTKKVEYLIILINARKPQNDIENKISMFQNVCSEILKTLKRTV